MCHAGAIKTDDSCIVLKVRLHKLCSSTQTFFSLLEALLSRQTLPCLVRMCSKEHLLEVRVEGAETLAYLIEPDVELQRIACTTDHLVAMLADYFKYPSSVSAITDIKRVSNWLKCCFTEVEGVLWRSSDMTYTYKDVLGAGPLNAHVELLDLKCVFLQYQAV